MSKVDQSLEQLLSKASPRPVPDEAGAIAAREAVMADWRVVAGRRRTRRKLIRFATAATILIGVVAFFTVLRAPTEDFIRVASIQKSFGSVYVLGEQSEVTRADQLSTVYAGQTIVTGSDAGMALSWGRGGSVRLDKSTEVEFSNDNTVRLQTGRIYFDSLPLELIARTDAGGAPSFQIETEHGTVSHFGTQFMTEVSSSDLKVSVREGQVEVEGRYYPHTASRGEQVVFSGRQHPVVLSVPSYGDTWDWIQHTSPPIDVDGRSVHAFLTWVGRELGMRVEYADEAVASLAHEALLEGHVDTAPAEALRLRMLTAALDWRFAEGVIYVSNSN